MATVFQTKDRHGNPHPKWRYKYVDYAGVRRTGTGTDSKRETEKLANQAEAHSNAIRNGWAPPPKPSSVRRPFGNVVKEYLAWGEAQGGRRGLPWSSKHAKRRRAILGWWEEKLRLDLLQDLEGSLAKVEKVLREFQSLGRAGKTLQNQSEALAAFCDWCEEREYFDRDPLRRLGKFDTTPKMVRRALSLDEIHRLLAVSAPKRRLTYEVALTTGLRAKELRSLRLSNLDVVVVGLHLEGRWTKNRKRDFQPLPAWLVEELAKAIVGRGPSDKLLHVPRDAARMIRRDLGKAGIPVVTAEGKVDFHALRVTASTLADDNGGSVKDVQEFARHSTPQLTYGRYVKARVERLAALTERIGAQLQPEGICPTGVQRGNDASGALDVTADKGSGKDGNEEERREGIEPANPADQTRTDAAPASAQLGHEPRFAERAPVESRTEADLSGTYAGHKLCPTGVQQPDTLSTELLPILAALPLEHRQALLRLLRERTEAVPDAAGEFVDVPPASNWGNFTGFSAASRTMPPLTEQVSGFSGFSGFSGSVA